MTEKRFVKGYHTIRDTKENKTYDFRVDIICNLLNELDEKWIAEFSLRETLQLELQRVESENEQLKKELEQDDLKNIKEANIKLFDENEQLKQLNIPVDEIQETVRDYKGRIVGVYYNEC